MYAIEGGKKGEGRWRERQAEEWRRDGSERKGGKEKRGGSE